jgi:hypothetical protein
MLPRNSISDDAVDSHVGTVLREGRARAVVRHNLKLGELLSVACDRVFVIPGDGGHEVQWQESLVRLVSRRRDNVTTRSHRLQLRRLSIAISRSV